MKNKFKWFVYLILSIMFLATSTLVVPMSASADNTVKLSELSAGNTVNFGGQTWIVLNPSTGYLLLQGFYGTRAFDPNLTQIFDSTDSNNIAYYLNNDFYNSLHFGDRWLVQPHNWTIGNENNEALATVNCNIGLISYSEWKSYKSSVGYTNKYVWTRTPVSTPLLEFVWSVYPSGSLAGYYTDCALSVRPALYLSPDISVSGGNGGTVLGGTYHVLPALTNSTAAGTVTGGGIYANGTSATLTATPNTGYTFVNWTNENGTSVSTDASYIYTMGTADTILVANFQHAPIIPTITVVNGVPFSVTVLNTYGTLTGTNNTYGTLTSVASGNDNVISGTLTGVPSTPTDITLGNGTIKIKAVNPPSTNIVNGSFY